MPDAETRSRPLTISIRRPASTLQTPSCHLNSKPLPDTPVLPPPARRPFQSVTDFEELPPHYAAPLDKHPTDVARTFRALFTFTAKRHVPVLAFSVLCSILASLVPALQAYLLGKIFTTFARFGAGGWSEVDFKEDLARFDVYLICLGGLCWALGGTMFAGWTWFGALQARSARESLLSSLAKRPISWYDQRQDGMGALATKING